MHLADRRDQAVAKKYFMPFVERFRDHSPVLELASGQGIFQDLLKSAGISAEGVELDEALYRACRDRGLNVTQANLFSYLESLQQPRFGGCFASHIVEHFLPQEVDTLFRDVHKAVRPGGIFIVLTPNIANLKRAAGDFWRDPTHVRPYPIPALHKLLRKNQWQVLESGEHSDRPPSIKRQVTYWIRNLLMGRHWVGDDVWVIAQRSP